MSDSKEENYQTDLTEREQNSSDESNPDDSIPEKVLIDKNRRLTMIPPTHQPKSVDHKPISDVTSVTIENENEDDFDTFILRHFKPFSGSQDVIEWLDSTEQKFNSHHISRNLRYLAVPLLVESNAKRKYIQHKKNIHSFDDFYEFLLENYDQTSHNVPSTQPKSFSNVSYLNDPSHNAGTHKSISFEDQQKNNNSYFRFLRKFTTTSSFAINGTR